MGNGRKKFQILMKTFPMELIQMTNIYNFLSKHSQIMCLLNILLNLMMYSENGYDATMKL